jgi:antitoxin component of MazEF toxin-antitoxin module
MAKTAKKRAASKKRMSKRAAAKRTSRGDRGATKRIVRHGNSMAVVLDKAVLAQAGVTEDTPLRISAMPGAIRIERADVGFTPERMAEMTEELRSDPEFVRMLEKLAE